MTKRSSSSLFRRFGSDQHGGIAIMAGLAIAGVALTAAFVMVKGEAYNAQQKLQMSANMAALAGASQLSGGASGAATAADQVSAANTVMGQQATMVAGYPKAVCLTSVGIPCTNGANAVQVKQQATVSLFMGGLFGQDTATVTATATAIQSGGTGTVADIMIVVDTTASMNGSDSTCSTSGATRLGCALAGARSLLTAFKPSQANVGLMAFPGVKNATEAAKDYGCPGSSPTTVAYNASPTYAIVPLSSDYKTSDAATSLNASSNLVKAVGGASGCGTLKAIGGFGTYYADAITAAQTALAASGRANAQKVIIFLSDGDSNASSSNVGSAKASNQCAAGVAAAQAATAAGTWVFTAAYGASTSVTPSSCSTDTAKPTSACATIKAMASSPAKFFPDTTSASGGCTSSVNSSSDVIGIFNAISGALTAPRLVPNTTS